jgi:AraC-like DNA-binding protein
MIELNGNRPTEQTSWGGRVGRVCRETKIMLGQRGGWPIPIDGDSGAEHIGAANPIWRFSGYHVEQTRCWGPISVDIVSRDAGEATWLCDSHLTVHALTDLRGTIRSEGKPAEAYGLHRGRVAFRPAGQVVTAVLPKRARVIQLLQAADTYNKFACDLVRGGVTQLEPLGDVVDPMISRIALTLAGNMEGAFLDHVLADTLSTALAVQILRHLVGAAAMNLAPSNGLSRERIQRVRDYVEAHLSDPLTLTDIAEVACLSHYHLSRSFKLATGIGLHRYVMLRRIERAKYLVTKSNLRLADIAGAVGFDSQASFTTRFRQELGVTPGRLRASGG